MRGADRASRLPVPQSTCRLHFRHVPPAARLLSLQGRGTLLLALGSKCRGPGAGGRERKSVWTLLPPFAAWPFGPVFPGWTDACRGDWSTCLPLQAEDRNGASPSSAVQISGTRARAKGTVLWLVGIKMAVSHFHSWNVSLGQSSPLLPEKRPYFSLVGSALRNLSQAHSGTESPRPWDASFIIVGISLVQPRPTLSFPFDSRARRSLGAGGGRRQDGSPACLSSLVPKAAVIRGSSDDICFLLMSLDYQLFFLVIKVCLLQKI